MRIAFLFDRKVNNNGFGIPWVPTFSNAICSVIGKSRTSVQIITSVTNTQSRPTEKLANLHFPTGPYAIAVPGQIAGMWAAWQRFGRVPWRDLFQPAIHLARYGMRVDPALARAISGLEETIREEPSLR